jgi:hypothetical protein
VPFFPLLPNQSTLVPSIESEPNFNPKIVSHKPDREPAPDTTLRCLISEQAIVPGRCWFGVTPLPLNLPFPNYQTIAWKRQA